MTERVTMLINTDVWKHIQREAAKRETTPAVIIAAAMDCFDQTTDEAPESLQKSS